MRFYPLPLVRRLALQSASRIQKIMESGYFSSTGVSEHQAIALIQEGKLEEALPIFEALAQETPDSFVALGNLANLLSQMGRFETALPVAEKTLMLKPGDAGMEKQRAYILHGAGFICLREGRLEEAKAYLVRSVEADPANGSTATLFECGSAFRVRGEYAEATRIFDLAIQKGARNPEHFLLSGSLLMTLGDAEAARARYTDGLTAYPEFLPLHWAMTMAHLPTIWTSSDQVLAGRLAFDQALQVLSDRLSKSFTDEGEQMVGNTRPFLLSYQEQDNKPLLERYGHLCTQLMSRWRAKYLPDVPVPVRQPRQGPVRLGIVSANFRRHSVWDALIKGWLQSFSNDRLTLILFDLGCKDDLETAFAREKASTYISGKRSLAAWARCITEQSLDVLIYPEIGMETTSIQLASLRLVPIQAVWWGHPETTGFKTMDYFLSAEAFEPPDAQRYYTERLVRFPGLGTRYPRRGNPTISPVLDHLNLPTDRALLICPGAPFKYLPEHDAVWVQISKTLGPEAVLVFFTNAGMETLLSQQEKRLEAAFEAAGLNFREQVCFIPFQPVDAFHALMRRAHVFLDTLGFSGFNTVMHALEAGIPVVTYEGAFLRGRFGAGILKRLNLSELITHSTDEYVERVVQLVRDPIFRETLRKQVLERGAALFDDPLPAQAIEEWLEAITAEQSVD